MEWKVVVYVMAIWIIFMTICYILLPFGNFWLFGTFFPTLVHCTKKNLAALARTVRDSFTAVVIAALTQMYLNALNNSYSEMHDKKFCIFTVAYN
jgi:hypothetical protein